MEKGVNLGLKLQDIWPMGVQAHRKRVNGSADRTGFLPEKETGRKIGNNDQNIKIGEIEW